MVEIARIGPTAWELFRDVRLASLSESPSAFGSRYADSADASAEPWQARLRDVPLTLVAHRTHVRLHRAGTAHECQGEPGAVG